MSGVWQSQLRPPPSLARYPRVTHTLVPPRDIRRRVAVGCGGACAVGCGRGSGSAAEGFPWDLPCAARTSPAGTGLHGGGVLWALPSGSVPNLRWESGSEVAANSAVHFLLVF